MTALQQEITATQIALFQVTGRLLSVAEEVKQEREKLVDLLRKASAEKSDKREAPK